MYVRRSPTNPSPAESAPAELTFQVSGKLWRDALVMIDRETGSLWSQITGAAFRGPLAGAELAYYPSEMTTWKEWRAAHPDTKVLLKEEEARGDGSRYARYFDDPAKQGIFGRSVDDDRLPPKTVVVAIEKDGEAVAIPRDGLVPGRVLRVTLGETPVAVVATRSGGVHAYAARAGDDLPELHLAEGKLVASGGAAAGSWDAATGRALSAEASEGGRRDLIPVRAHVVYWFGWVSFFPNTAIQTGE